MDTLITLDNFEHFIKGKWQWDEQRQEYRGLYIQPDILETSGGKIGRAEIDRLQDYPDAQNVLIMGLYQDTFEYFIERYGKQFKAINFFKNKMVKDWSALADLSGLEFVHYFYNLHISELWDMRQNYALQGVSLASFNRLGSLKGIEAAPQLKFFNIGEWWMPSDTHIDHLRYFEHSGLQHLHFWGKKVDTDMSFLRNMPELKTFDCNTGLLSTEQIAWIVGNCPQLQGFALSAMHECMGYDNGQEKPYINVHGKRKPFFPKAGNEAKMQKYQAAFDKAVAQLRGQPYPL